MQPLFACFTQNLNYALGWMVVHSLWQATAIAIVAGIVSIALRKKKARVRYWVHNTALVAVLVSAVVTFCLYYDFSLAPPTYRFIPQEVSEVAAIQPTITNQSILNTQTAPLSIEGLKDYFNHNIYLIVTIWALGVAIFILRLLGSVSYVYVLRNRLNFPADEYWTNMMEGIAKKAGLTKTIDLVESALVRSPMVIGHLKPLILFPIGAINRLNPQEVEAILAHELAHVMRNDYLFNIIQSVIEALFYFHPAVWWISANIRTERENACDDMAIDLCGNSMTYAKALVLLQEMAYYPSPQMAMGFAGQRKHQLLHRVQRILNQPQNRSNVVEKLAATFILLITMVALSIGSNRTMHDSFLSNSPIEPIPTMEETPSVSTSLSAEKPADNFLKFYKDDKLDSLKLDFDLNDGTYNYADKMEKILITVKDNTVVGLNINGIAFTPEQIPNFDRKLYYILRKMPTVPTGLADKKAVTTAEIPTTSRGSYNYSFGQNANQPAAIAPESPVTPAFPAPPNFNTDDGGTVTKTYNDGTIEIRLPDGSREVIKPQGDIVRYDRNGREIERISGDAATQRQNTSGFKKQNYYSENTDEFEERIDRINDKIDNLQDAIQDCDCRQKDPSWFIWAEARLAAQPALVESNKNARGLQSIDNELNTIERQFKKIKNQNGTTNCNGCPTGAAGAGKTDTTRSFNSSGSGATSYNSSGNGYSYGTGSSDADAEKARKDAERQRDKAKDKAKEDGGNGKATNSIFTNLVRMGYISYGKKCQFEFDNRALRVNGTWVSVADYQNIKKDFESKLMKKSSQYAISFTGVVNSISEGSLNLKGSFSTSINSDDD